MKMMRVFCLSLLIVLQGIPVMGSAQETVRAFILPDGRVSEAYQVNIEQALHDTYKLRLVQKGAPSSTFQWRLVSGELPASLKLTSDGVITGKPSTYRELPYRFQLVVTSTLSHSESEPIEFSLSVRGPRIMLVSINATEIVPPDGDPSPTDSTSANMRLRQTEAVLAEQAGKGDESASQLSAHPTAYGRSLGSGAEATTYMQRVSSSAPCVLPPEFIPPSGSDVIMIDVPTRTAKDNVGNIVNLDDEQEFGRSKVIRIVFDNKNPYLYQAKYTREQKVVTETAIPAFLAALGGVITDFLPAQPKEEAEKKNPAQPQGVQPSANLPSDLCQEAHRKVDELNGELDIAAADAKYIEDNLPGVKDAADALMKLYQRDRNALYIFGKKREELYCGSLKLLADTAVGIGEANTTILADLQKKVRRIKGIAETVPERVEFIQSHYPSECVDENSLLKVRLYGRGLSDAADGYQKTINDIKAALEKIENSRQVVETVLRDPNNFFEVHAEGGGKATKLVAGKLELTPLKDVAEAKTVDPITVNLKFGEAPYFSLSGGLVFSGLRKLEFERVQGFERDRQGNEVLVNGKPNLTTVVGLKEGSRTRLSPMIMLHGRIPGTSHGLLDAVHMTLGITAKNDGKGTDPEFLIGPSFSFLENNIFFTVGGYAGKQQKLEGDLFRGAAVPSTVSELPIRKDYRWSFGFGITYRLPINKPSTSK